MPDYIDREKALQRFEEIKKSSISLKDSVYLDGVMAILEALPAADVAPVVRGKWEPGNPICPICGNNKFKGLDADVWADWMPPFCPNCGARCSAGRCWTSR